MVLFLRNNRFNVTLILADYQLRRKLAAKHIWAVVITCRGILDSPPQSQLIWHFLFLLVGCSTAELHD